MTFLSKTFSQLTTVELYEILQARSEIFMLEQNIHCQDMDGIDYHSLHCFLWKEGKVVGYLRAFYQDETRQVVRVGRVLTRVHGCGWGRVLMEHSLAAIREKMPCQTISMDAQKQAVGFYEKLGFSVTSDDFWEEGVLHQKMELALSGADGPAKQ